MTRIVSADEFKVISSAESKEYGEWDIEHIPTNTIVAKISTYSGYGASTKSLYVKSKSICKVKNQKEALVKLAEFFTENKKEMTYLTEIIVELKKDLDNIKYDRSRIVIGREIARISQEWDKLAEYNLV